MPIPVTAIFDIGKTNKKFFLFDENLKELKEEYIKFPLVNDEDGDPCDDLEKLTTWIRNTIDEICKSSEYEVKGLNFSTYGATLVHLDENGEPVTSLYNYLKEFPADLEKQFFETYSEEENNLETASPTLGMLNSGLQLYWLKHTKPHLFSKVKHTLHFPQYLSYLFTGELVTEPTSIGCHTRLWDYSKNRYHDWVINEGLDKLLPAYVSTTQTYTMNICGHEVKTGVGIHDSSSALASYMQRSKDPFLLISTGTWSITLNPFTKEPLTAYELHRQCLNYLNINGMPVKASRFLLGYELDHQLINLNAIFDKDAKYYKSIEADEAYMDKLIDGTVDGTYYPQTILNHTLVEEIFPENQWHPEGYKTFEEAYHQVMWGLVKLQIASIKLAQGKSNIKKIFVDGGFVHNQVYVELIKHYLSDHEIIFSDFPLGSAYGAAGVLKGTFKEEVLG